MKVEPLQIVVWGAQDILDWSGAGLKRSAYTVMHIY
jgi:hypothetical protein